VKINSDFILKFCIFFGVYRRRMPSHRFNWPRPRRYIRFKKQVKRNPGSLMSKFRKDVDRKTSIIFGLSLPKFKQQYRDMADMYILWPPHDTPWKHAFHDLAVWYRNCLAMIKEDYMRTYKHTGLKQFNAYKKIELDVTNRRRPPIPHNTKLQLSQHAMMSKGGNLQHLKQWERKPKEPRHRPGPKTRTVYLWKRRGTATTSCTDSC